MKSYKKQQPSSPTNAESVARISPSLPGKYEALCMRKPCCLLKPRGPGHAGCGQRRWAGAGRRTFRVRGGHGHWLCQGFSCLKHKWNRVLLDYTSDPGWKSSIQYRTLLSRVFFKNSKLYFLFLLRDSVFSSSQLLQDLDMMLSLTRCKG